MDLLRRERDNAIIASQSVATDITFELFIAYRKLYRGYVDSDIRINNYYGEDKLKSITYDDKLIAEINQVYASILFKTEIAFMQEIYIPSYVIMGIIDLKIDLDKHKILNEDLVTITY